MKPFLDENFLLHNKTAEALFHEHAKDLPIIDYHCHLPPDDIANDRRFENLTRIWLDGDHYKWRAMRANAIPEKFCTGSATDWEKFEKWAETVPYTLRNPLYHWTHMELQRTFGIHKLLNPATAREIFDHASALLQTREYGVRNILRKMKVEVLCTTDDPVDKLEFHKKTKDDGFEIKVLPSWRPDKAMAIENVQAYNLYLGRLEQISGISISSFKNLIDALQLRHDFFHEQGCRLSDHGLEHIPCEDFRESEIGSIFFRVRNGIQPDATEMEMFRSAMLYHLAVMDHAKNWVQQFHLGAMRNNSSRMFDILGADKGFDSIGDFVLGKGLSKFFDRLDKEDHLARTIIYNLNPRDNEMIATMAGNFNDGSVAGKMQFGSAWWFLDQKDGMEKQLNTLSSLGLLSRFIGMLTDSRSFLSYPRHEYFRRILCNLLGRDVENGEIPADKELLGRMVESICYYNAKNYFNF
jgi:glucuronate isomerase